MMKINLLLLSFFLLFSFDSGAIAASEWRNNDKLLEVIRDISDRYNVHFTYDREIVEDVEIDDYTPEAYAGVDDALSQVLAGTKLKYVMLEMKYVIIYQDDAEGMKSLEQMVDVLEKIIEQKKEVRSFSALTPLQGSTSFRNIHLQKHRMVLNISGTVTDQNGEPLIGVNVLVQGTNTGTATDFDGHFALEDISENATLIFSYVGYQTQEVVLNGRSNISVVMVEDSQTLDEIVVVGYGTQRKREVTGSLKQLGGDELASQPSIQTSASLMGKISGVQVIQSSGQPGKNSGTIRIRGTGTLGNSNPLILVDGVPGNINNVPSSDIESITILKDASASAVYGSRAANGVILVTTKRGKEGGIKVSYGGFAGFQQPTRQPKFVGGLEYMQLENMARTNVGSSPTWSESFMNEWKQNHEIDPDNYPNTDWVKEVFSESGFQQSHNLRVSGGNKTISFLGSLIYDDENGNVKNFGYKRYTARLNTDIAPSEKFNISFDMSLQRRDRDEATDERDIIQDSYRVPPVFAARYSDGSWGPGWNGDNPVAAITDGGFVEEDLIDIYARISATYSPSDFLDISMMYAPRRGSVFSTDMQRQYLYRRSPDGEFQLNPAINFLNKSYSQSFSNTFNSTVEFKKDLGGNRVNLLMGYEFIDNRSDQFKAYRDNYILQDYSQLNAGSPANQKNSGSASEWALQSFFGRFNYNYKYRYLVEANLRYDGSSRFSQNNKWGLFPSFSAGWIVTEEPFMETIDFMSLFKIRGSWGQLGNQEIGNYAFASVVNLNRPYIKQDAPVTGAAILDLANPNISWEKSTSKGLGVDLAFLEDRFFFTYDYFSRFTEDILLDIPIPLIIGLNPPVQNAGSVKNTGWEIELGYRNSSKKDLGYQVSANISNVHNEVTDLFGTGPYITSTAITAEGLPISSIYGYQSDGFFQSEEEIASHAKQFGTLAPGDIKYVDQNGDGIINSEDRVVIGDPFPSLNFGVDINMNYKNFDLSVFFQGIGNRDVRLTGFAARAFYNAGRITQWQADNYWTPDNPDAKYPRLTQGDSHNNFENSDFWVYDASYLRWRNVQIGYSLPSKMVNKIRVENIRIYFMGQNLATFFDSLPEGIDPNVPNGTGGAYYSPTRLLSFGADINF